MAWILNYFTKNHDLFYQFLCNLFRFPLLQILRTILEKVMIQHHANLEEQRHAHPWLPA